MTIHSITTESCIVRSTASTKGRTLQVAPGRTAARQLHYGRIILNGGDPSVRVDTNDRETGLIGLKGSAQVKTEEKTYRLNRYDAVYVPRDASIEITPGSEGCDLAEVASPVTKQSQPARRAASINSPALPQATPT